MPVGAPQPEPAVDILHGVKVVDPYRWLEDRDSDQTREWLSEQMRVHERYFSKLRGLNNLRSRVSEYLNVEILDQPAQVGSYTFFRRRRKHVYASGISNRAPSGFWSIRRSKDCMRLSGFIAFQKTDVCLPTPSSMAVGARRRSTLWMW